MSDGSSMAAASRHVLLGGDWNAYLVEAHYDFRMCGKCKQPFQAGLRQCGAAGEAEAEADAAAIKCENCQNDAKANCPKHGKEFIVWKCRYCCGNCGCPDGCNGLAVFACFGYLHACKYCHGG